MIGLGDVARDRMTGFEGVVIAETRWIYGCRRLTLQPQKLQENGEPIKAQTFDEPQLEGVQIGSFTPTPAFESALAPTPTTGGPRPDPERPPTVETH